MRVRAQAQGLPGRVRGWMGGRHRVSPAFLHPGTRRRALARADPQHAAPCSPSSVVAERAWHLRACDACTCTPCAQIHPETHEFLCKGFAKYGKDVWHPHLQQGDGARGSLSLCCLPWCITSTCNRASARAHTHLRDLHACWCSGVKAAKQDKHLPMLGKLTRPSRSVRVVNMFLDVSVREGARAGRAGGGRVKGVQLVQKICELTFENLCRETADG